MKSSPALREIVEVLFPNRDWEEFVNAGNLERCPGLSLFLRLWWRYTRGKDKATLNDKFDITYVPAYVRADLSLTERQMAGFVRAADEAIGARVYSNIEKLLMEK